MTEITEDNPIKLLSDRQLDEIIARYRRKNGMVLTILEEVQQRHENKYLPLETLRYLAQKIPLPLSQLYSVVTFYSFFSLQPQGKHFIQVCRGTACHAQGSKSILDALISLLGLKKLVVGNAELTTITTADNLFTIRVVACFGQCALAPVVVIDEAIHANTTIKKIKKEIERIKKNE